MNTSGNDFGVMNMFQNSPTGRMLLADAEQKGVKIEFKPDNGDSQRGKFNPNTNTITVEHASLEKMTETLGHELVHATTKENGNSMKEEKMAFITGEKIAQELGVNKNPHSQSYWNHHVDTAYKNDNLRDDNGIMSAMQSLERASGHHNRPIGSSSNILNDLNDFMSPNRFNRSNGFSDFGGFNNIGGNLNFLGGLINGFVQMFQGLFSS